MRLLSILLGCQLVLTTAWADLSSLDTNAPIQKYTNVTALAPGPYDATIAKIVSRLLERSHFSRKEFTDEISSSFFDRYLDSLDNLHLYFLQSDVEEIEGYRYYLDELTQAGDTTPARVIFKRFRRRLDQQYDYAMSLLETNQFEFTGTNRYVVNRKDLPRPKDLEEAKQVWRERLEFEYLQEKLNKEDHANIVRIITRRYNRVLRWINDYDADDVLQVYLTALARVYDPHSDYMGKAQFENFSINMKLSLFGIGALLRSEDGICRIQSLTPEGPAERGKKLKPDDKIIAVAQSNQPPVDVVDMPLRKVVELIRGPEGTEVRLTIIPSDASDPSLRKVIPIIRGQIKLEDQAAKAKIFEIPVEGQDPTRLGYIDLPSFYSEFEMDRSKEAQEKKSTTRDVALLIKKLVEENVTGIILDLRRNGGGSLEEAINLTGLFIEEGPVVQVKETTGHITVNEDENEPYPGEYYQGPVLVLTSRFSASASEILAGALQDYDRALLVGESSTHGKGTVQSLINLEPIFRASGVMPTNNPGALKVTIRKFYRASGASTQKKGVIPDIVLPSVYNDAKVGESSLENPMEWDEIPSAQFEKLNRVTPYLADVKLRSEKRVGSDPDFAYLKKEIERVAEKREEKSVSMNEQQRHQEKEDAEARSKARKKELASRPPAPDTVYEITLKDVAVPGLPDPISKTNALTTSSVSSFYNKQAMIGESKLEAHPAMPSANVPKIATDGPEKESSEPSKTEGSDEAEDEDIGPNLDIALEEAKRILLDLISLSNEGKSLAGTPSKSKPAN